MRQNVPARTEKIEMRESGIELLKIFAMILIVICHVSETIRYGSACVPYEDYVLDLSAASPNIQHTVLASFNYFGVWGNGIFFVCSAWFLQQSSRYNKKKWLFMLIEVWVVSVTILLLSLIIWQGNLSVELIVKSLFPTTFSNNWYLTCYLLFYPIHPILNGVIKRMSRQALFRICAAMFFLYFCLGFVEEELFFSSMLLLWITIYFIIAYMRMYLTGFSENVKKNLVLLAAGFAGFILLVMMLNLLGLHSSLNHAMLAGAVNSNPFLLAVSVAMFNLVRKVSFKNWLINRISNLLMLVYIIHENIILRRYCRPYLLHFVHEQYGYEHIAAWVLLLAAAIFLASLLCSAVYAKTVRKLVVRTSDVLYTMIRKKYLAIEQQMCKFH